MAKELRVLSWNVLYSNERHDEILSYIQGNGADIVCLQEVSEELLGRLGELPYALASAVDLIFTTNAWRPEKGETKTHVAVLSKLPILQEARHAFPELPRETLHTRFFDNLLHVAGIWKGGQIHGKEAVSVDVEFEGDTLRVFSAHLALLTPQIRLAEFAALQQSLLQNGMNIIAGDLNILEGAYIKVWNWMRGGRLRDAMPWANERKYIEKVFAESQLKNPFRGLVTHPISDSQLDHILVPKNAEVVERIVGRKKFGSDHAPIQVVIRI